MMSLFFSAFSSYVLHRLNDTENELLCNVFASNTLFEPQVE